MSGSRRDAAELVEEGLQLYTLGRLDEALERWRQALEIDPQATRVAEYIQYVRDNRTALDQSFQAARAAVSEAEAAVGGTPPEDAVYNEFDGASGRFHVDTSDVLDWQSEKVERTTARARDEDPGAGGPGAAELDVHVEVDLGALGINGGIESTERIPFEEYRATVERSRPKKHTPLTVVRGEGTTSGDDFEPAEPTPVGVELPEPLLVPRGESGDDLEAQAELKADRTTPQTLGRISQADAGSCARSASPLRTTSDRLDPIPDIPPPLAPPEADLSELGLEDSAPARPGGGISARATAPTATHLDPLEDRAAFAQPADTRLSQPPSLAGDDIASLGFALENDGDPESLIVVARQLYEQGTNEGSLWLCERILEIEPTHGEAQALLKRNREALLQHYEELLQDIDAVPVVVIHPDQIVWQKLDHRAGFLLSRIDGMVSFGDLLDISGMDRFETCRILAQLVEQGVIAVGK